jgi:hypothetical protein
MAKAGLNVVYPVEVCKFTDENQLVTNLHSAKIEVITDALADWAKGWKRGIITGSNGLQVVQEERFIRLEADATRAGTPVAGAGKKDTDQNEARLYVHRLKHVRAAKLAGHWSIDIHLFHGIEECIQLIKVLLRNRIVFVIVTARATYC